MIVVFLKGLNTIVMLGVIGEYVWRLNEDVPKRPNYLIRERFL